MEEKKNRLNKSELLKLAVFAICVYIFLNFIIKIGYVPSESMQPTVNVGDFTVSNCLAYMKDTPQRGEIVIFKGEDGELLIKRVIGMPNDVITFVDGYVVINGMIAEEEYIDESIETNSSDTFVVPEGHYFVLGDNRESSYDSRFFEEPYISEDRIVAQLLFVVRTSDFIKLFKDE